MLNALTKQVVADLKEHFGVDEVYVMTSDVVGEFMNIALRKLKDVDISDERKVFEVMNTPVVFVRLMDVRYDEGRSGFRKMFTGWGWFNSYGRYLGLKLFTLVVGYEVRVYSLFFAQCLDLVSWFLFLKRSSEVVVRLNDEVSVRVPVSLLVEEVYESSFEFMLRGKGLKVYRVGGRLTALTYVFPVNIVGGRGEGYWKEIWSSVRDVSYAPVADVRLRFIDEFGNVLEEGAECLEKR